MLAFRSIRGGCARPVRHPYQLLSKGHNSESSWRGDGRKIVVRNLTDSVFESSRLSETNRRTAKVSKPAYLDRASETCRMNIRRHLSLIPKILSTTILSRSSTFSLIVHHPASPVVSILRPSLASNTDPPYTLQQLTPTQITRAVITGCTNPDTFLVSRPPIVFIPTSVPTLSGSHPDLHLSRL